MELQTGSANTKDWIEATKGMEIRAYIGSLSAALGTYVEPLTRQDSLDTEAQEWDRAAAQVLRDRADAWQRLAEL